MQATASVLSAFAFLYVLDIFLFFWKFESL